MLSNNTDTAFVRVVLFNNISGAFIVSNLKNKSLKPMLTSNIPPTAIGKSSVYMVLIGINLSYPSTFKTIS